MKAGNDTGARILGFVFFLIGLGLGYWQIYSPIQQAIQGEEYVSYSAKAVFLAPVAVLFGLFILVFGAEGLEFLAKRPSKPVMILIMILTVIFTFGCTFAMEYVMKSLGYS